MYMDLKENQDYGGEAAGRQVLGEYQGEDSQS